MSLKKFLIAISIFLIILIIAMLLFFFFITKKKNPEATLTRTFQSFLPFGDTFTGGGFIGNDKESDTTSNNTQNGEIGTGEEMVGNKKVPRLRQITTKPTAGSVILEKSREVIVDRVKKTIKETFVRYMDRGTGHIEEVKTTSFDIIQVSNTTIPAVYETIFSPNGISFLSRFLSDDGETIKTYSATLKNNTATTTPKTSSSTPQASTTPIQIVEFKDISGVYLEQNIREFALSPSRTKIISLLQDTEQGKIVSSDFNGLKSKIIFTSPLREWLLFFPTESKAVISTKPSGISSGVAYILDVASGGISKIASGASGFTVLPGRDLTYTILGEGGKTLSIKTIQTKDGVEVGQVLKTIPEKCVWAKTSNTIFYCAVPKFIPNALYPDDWYKGKIFFSDSIWKTDLKTGAATLIADPEKLNGGSLDITNLDISPADNYLTFINKKDLTLWGLDISSSQTKVATSTATTTPKK